MSNVIVDIMEHILDIFTYTSILLIILCLLFSGIFYKLIERGHKQYHESIGKPNILSVFYSSPTWEQLMRAKIAIYFSYGILFRGIPKNFPKDHTLKKLAHSMRILFGLVIVSFVIAFSLAIASSLIS